MNSAERLLKIYDELIPISKESSMRQVWASVFELNESDQDLEDNLVKLLTAVREQVDKTRTSLTAYGVPDDLTHPGFARLKETASATNLNAAWSGMKQSIQSPECRLSFACQLGC